MIDAWDDLYPMVVIALWGLILGAGVIGLALLIFDRLRSR